MGNIMKRILDFYQFDPFPSLEDHRFHVLTPALGQFLQGHTFALLRACEAGNYELVKKIVDDDPKVDVSSKNSLERDALMTTCFHGYRTTALRIAHFLLQCGARPTERDQNGSTCLMDAAGGGYIGLSELLLRNGADLHARDKNGVSVLMYACLSGSVKLVKMLLTFGATIWDMDVFGHNPVHYAQCSEMDHSSTLSSLLSSFIPDKEMPPSADTSDQTTSSDRTRGSSGSSSGSHSPTESNSSTGSNSS